MGAILTGWVALLDELIGQPESQARHGEQKRQN